MQVQLDNKSYAHSSTMYLLKRKKDTAQEKQTIVTSEARRDSYSSIELDRAIDADIFDSVAFEPTLGPHSPTFKSPMEATAPEPERVHDYVQNLILASKALRKADAAQRGLKNCIYTFRKEARSMGGYTKAGYAKIHKEIHLPEFENPEPGCDIEFAPNAYITYAFERGEDAIRELMEEGAEKDERVVRVLDCVDRIRAHMQTWQGAEVVFIQ